MLYKGPPPKAGIKLNGVDLLDLDPTQVRTWISSLPKTQAKIMRAIITQKMTPDDLPADYAREYGRPSLKKVPYMSSENDGYPYKKGHAPNCDGKKVYTRRGGGPSKMCWCEWIGFKSKK